MINKSLSIILILLVTFMGCVNENNSTNGNDSSIKESKTKLEMPKYVNNPEIQKKGMQQIKGLIDNVKPALKTSLKSDKSGIEGIKMCSSSAQEIGKKYNETLPKDSKVRRTAIKYRNPNNKPDATDLNVMKKLKADNNFDKPLVVDMDDHYRVYKALQVHKPCLICHGDSSKFSPELSKIIKEKYPNDLAINFKENEFRGVVVSEIKK